MTALARRPRRVVMLFLAAGIMCTTASTDGRPFRSVLTIHWGSEDHPANLVVDQAIREVLADHPEAIDYFAEYLESEHFPVEHATVALSEYLRQKYPHRPPPDVVIAVTDPALQFVLRYRDDLFRNSPIVFSGQGIAAATSRAASLTGVTVRAAYADTLELALRLHPSTERVFVVAKSPNSQLADTVRNELSHFPSRVQLIYLGEKTVPRLLAAIKAIPPSSVVLYIWHSQGDTGNLVYTPATARLVAQASPVPVYGTSDLYVGQGVVGGVMRGTRATGTRLGEMARDVLNGTRPQDMPIEKARIVATFDSRQLQRWGIDRSRLPPGSDIRFKEQTLWESYRSYVLGSVFVIAGQLLLIVGLVRQRARRRRAEATLRTSEMTLRTSFERIRQLADGLIKAQESTRAEIARDLHDDVCQDLFGVSVGLSSLRRSSGHLQEVQTQQDLYKLQSQAVGIAERVRRLSLDLHPPALRLLGLAAATKAHCIEVEKRHDVQVSFKAEGHFAHIHEDVALCLFRIAQEALRNGAVHGDARRLAVSMVRTDDEIELVVTDDGSGFDLELVRRNSSGLGLVSIEERARVVRGRVQILSEPRRGTIVRVRVPTAPVDSSHTATEPP